MESPFPGMDPYLEQAGVWSEVHSDLIGGIRRFLTPLLRPKYRVAMEQRTYLAVAPPDDLVGEPDVLISTDNPASPIPAAMPATVALAEPLVGQLPVPQEIKERYLEIRTVSTKEVVTVIEILSPANKRAGLVLQKSSVPSPPFEMWYGTFLDRYNGREQYEEKRTEVLGSYTHLIEIDLLRAGRPLPMTIDKENHYRIIVSRSRRRPSADFYLFSVRQPIPNIPVPLLRGDPEPTIELNQILHELYDQSGYDLDIDYTQAPPPPAFSTEDAAWVRETAGRFGEVEFRNGSTRK